MIVDITNEVLTELKETLTDVLVTAEFPQKKPVFPCLTIRESSNVTHIDSVDSGGERHNNISFEINIFSNAKNKTTQVRNIRSRVDEIMSGKYNMTRDFSDEVPNFADSNVFRYVLRYSCVVDSTKRIYRR